jgi:hypothetical protein
MKRNPKPFSVEIKKSRDPGQRRQLPPRGLFETTLVETDTVFRKEEAQAVVAPSAAPRILPSIVEPVWSSSEPVEPVRRKSSPRSKPNQSQMKFNLNAIASEGATDAPAATPMMLKAVPQTDASPVEEAASPILEVQAQETKSTKTRSRKPRKKASKIVEPVTAPEPVSQRETTSETQVIGPPLVSASRQADHHRLTMRQAAAAQLPRHERWKRRLHSAAW